MNMRKRSDSGDSGGDRRRLLAEALGARGDVSKLYPLSPAQERLWFIHQLLPDSPLYNVPVSIRLRGNLDVTALDKAWNEVVRRHTALRTVFRTVGGRPFQVVLPARALGLEALDPAPAETDPDRRFAAARSLGQTEERRPFDLRRDLPVRVSLFRVGDGDHLLVVVLHHIVSDGWSLDVLFRELSILYEAYAAGRTSPLPEPAMQFTDYAVDETNPRRTALRERQASLWKARLAGLPPLLDLPSSRPRPPAQSFRGSVARLNLPRDLADQVRSLCRSRSLTPYVVLLAAFLAVLFRYTGREDLVVGSAAANRSRRELEDLVGFLVNLVPIRVELTGRMSFDDLLGLVKVAALEAFSYEDLPFGALVAAVVAERDLSHHPLFQVAFSLHTPPAHPLRLAGLSVEALPVDTGTAKLDLTLLVSDGGADGGSGGGSGAAGAGGAPRNPDLELALEYSLDLFDAAWAKRFLGCYQTLLAGALLDPGRPLSRLPVLTSADRGLVLERWSGGPGSAAGGAREPDGPAGTVALARALAPALFEAAARRNPVAPAVWFEGSVLTYGEIDSRAERMAAHLGRLGVGPETLVALLLERSPLVAVAMLGVLKAGGAYVPLDPAHPPERLALILEDTRAPVVVTEEGLLPRLPGTASPRHVVCLDRDLDSPERGGAGPRSDPRVGPGNLAYVIYTSGSTGQPKGVLVEHGGVANLAEAEAQAFGLGAEDRVLQFASLTFDASVFEMMMAWRVGACLVFARREDLLPGPPLAELLRAAKVTVATLPPSAVAALPQGESLPDLRTLVVAGEACPAEVVDRWAPGRRFFNAYGPTETTVWATAAACVAGTGAPSIGSPIRGAWAYVLDRNLELVPPGVPGELCVGGAGLARGYLGRPDLTAERFVPDAFSNGGGRRLYRTGDLVRLAADGSLEFLGRLDDQVKIRGFRIEPGEIEAALALHPEVADCAVVADGGGRNPKRLVAFVALEPDRGQASPDLAAALRTHLRSSLPEYMVPAAITVVPRLPKTASGKTDRQVLAAQAALLPGPSGPGGPRRTPREGLATAEDQVAAIWAEMLGRDDFGPHDNFFDLGGHSLLLVEVAARLSEVFGRRIPVVELFRHTTVRTLAAWLDAAEAATATAAPAAMDPVAVARVRGALRSARREAAAGRARPVSHPPEHSGKEPRP